MFDPIALTGLAAAFCRYFAIRGPDGEKLEFNQIL